MALHGNKRGTDPGTPSAEYVQMEGVRRLPRMLDSSRVDGGINRLLDTPGGRLFEPGETIKRIQSLKGNIGGAGGPQATRIVDIGQQRFVGQRPLLIQHEAEGNQDYRFRSAIASPRNGYWHAVESLAGRPFKQPIVIKNAPDVLSSEGAWVLDCDLKGNSLRTVVSRQARRSAGYGLGYFWVDFSQRFSRPFVRSLPPETVSRVTFEGDRRRIHVRMSRPEFERPEDVVDPSVFPDHKHLILVFRDGDQRATDADQWASFEVYTAKDDDGTSYHDRPEPQLIDGEPQLRVSLEPHRMIPFKPMPTGELSETHLVFPPMLEAAQIDYLLLQVTSNMEYATIVANTFIRFAKGLNKGDIDLWRVLGPQYFYATTNKDADMKWVTLGAEALSAGMELSQFLMRALEVAGLAPMLSRSPGDERATGMALASARVTSVAEAYYLQWQAAVADLLNIEAVHTVGTRGATQELITVELHHDLGMDPQAIEHGTMLTRLYLDPHRDYPAAAFWGELLRIGLVSEDVDMEALVSASESSATSLDKERIKVQKAEVLVNMMDQGHFATQAGAEVVYRALQGFGVLPSDPVIVVEDGNEAKSAEEAVPLAVQMAAETELARQRKRNLDLFLAEQMSPESFWAAEEATEPTPVNLDAELALDRPDRDEDEPDEDESAAATNPPVEE